LPTEQGDRPTLLSIEVQASREATVLVVRGELDLMTGPRLRGILFDPTACPGPRIVVDLREVTFMDSSGLSTLIAARRWISRGAGELSLVCQPGPVMRVLDITGLLSVFTVHASVEAALPERHESSQA
jgi:anti-anti-sigma factor